MARIYAFRALRYNPSQVRLEDVVTQPYDKISPSMQQAYYRRSPYNLVRIILGLPELFDSAGEDDVYTRAARDFREWRSTGILTVEKDPCIFAYAQRFAVPGSAGIFRERRGFIALGELRDYADQVVFRHEQTLTAPKSDRLSLLRATRAHFGQIFMLYSDPGQTAERMLFAPNTTPDLEVTDEYGVQHSLSRVSDPAVINLVASAMADKKLIIADGHHRYETALAYARRHQPETALSSERNSYVLPQPPYPEAAAMMTFVNMDSEGLLILPTHRVIHSLGVFVPSDLVEKAAAYFTVEALDTADPAELTARLAAAGRQRTALIVVTAEGRYLLTARPDAIADALARLPERQRRLDVVVLHTLLIEKLLGIPPEAVREQTNIRYLRDAGEAVEQVVNGDANAAFLMNPLPLEQLREVAFAGDVLPQKSTDFYPKLLSGLTIYALD
jgi:uncharacterized protein (DUF1015 family)